LSFPGNAAAEKKRKIHARVAKRQRLPSGAKKVERAARQRENARRMLRAASGGPPRPRAGRAAGDRQKKEKNRVAPRAWAKTLNEKKVAPPRKNRRMESREISRRHLRPIQEKAMSQKTIAVTAKEFERATADIMQASKSAPVFITRGGEATHVLMSIEQYAKLVGDSAAQEQKAQAEAAA
jgi:hypothetical protein